MTRAIGFMTFLLVEDPPFRALAPYVLWPARPHLSRALEIAYALPPRTARAVAARSEESDWGDGTLRGPLPDLSRGSSIDTSRALSAEEAWEKLAPPGFRDAPARFFLGDTVDPCEPTKAPILRTTWGAKSLLSAPPTRAAVLAIAGNPEGISEAESLAREACNRFAPWGAVTPPRIVWHIERAPTLMRYRGAIPLDARLDALLGLSTEELDRGQTEVNAQHVPRGAWRFEWQRAARHDLRRSEAWERAASMGAPFASQPNPYDPLLRIWRQGYALEAMTEEALILGANAVSPDLLRDDA
jgi:hypothetical protein